MSRSEELDAFRAELPAGLLGLKFGQMRRDELGQRWVIVGACNGWVSVKRSDQPKKNWHPRGAYEVPLREAAAWTLIEAAT